MGPGRVIGVTGATISAAGYAGEVITKTEAVILNVPLSMLLVAIAGTMIGFFILPSKEAARISPNPGSTGGQRVCYLLFSLALVGAAVMCYAVTSSWVVQIAVFCIDIALSVANIEKAVNESAAITAAGIVGIGIRVWLPTLLKAVERRADRVIGGSP